MMLKWYTAHQAFRKVTPSWFPYPWNHKSPRFVIVPARMGKMNDDIIITSVEGTMIWTNFSLVQRCDMKAQPHDNQQAILCVVLLLQICPIANNPHAEKKPKQPTQ